MFCGKCGASIPDNDVFCGKCGTKRHDSDDFKNRSKPAAVASQTHNHQLSSSGTQSKSIGRKAVIISAVIVLCSIGAAVAIILAARSDGNGFISTGDNQPSLQVSPSVSSLPTAGLTQPPSDTSPTPIEPTLSDTVQETSFTPNTVGNTSGNIVNGGIAAIQGNWIYYADVVGGGIYAIRTDGTGKFKVCDDQAWYVNVIGEWVYYSNWSDDGKPYAIRTDGSDKVKICDDRTSVINAVGDRLYYRNWSDEGKLYTVHIDGTDRLKLSDDLPNYNVEGTDDDVTVVGDWVYYVIGDDDLYNIGDDDMKIYAIRTDGSGRYKVSDDWVWGVNVVGEWIYYCNGSDGGKLYSIRTDGTDKRKICDDIARSINVIDDWVFFFSGGDEDGLYTIRTDGTGKQKINDDSGSFSTYCINVVDEWVFYIIGRLGVGYNFYSLNLASGDKQLLGTSPTSTVTDAQDIGKGNTMFQFEVTDNMGLTAAWNVHTDKVTVGEALLEVGLIEGEVSSYGLEVKYVNGIRADFIEDSAYWAFCVDGYPATVGSDVTYIEQGKVYAFVYTNA